MGHTERTSREEQNILAEHLERERQETWNTELFSQNRENRRKEREIKNWNAVHKALAELYELWAKQGSKGTTLGALENLMRAYDKWLD